MSKSYAVIGKRGVAIATDWPTAVQLRTKMAPAYAKGFENFEEASDYAMQYLAEVGYRYPMKLYPNRIWRVYPD